MLLQAAVIPFIEIVSVFMGMHSSISNDIKGSLAVTPVFKVTDGTDCACMCSFGRMVACFQYAPINVYSVCLPPPKIEFNYDKQEWIQKEANEVQLFKIVLKNPIFV